MNPLNLVASSKAGDRYDAAAAVDPSLGALTIGAGRVTRGLVAFAVPDGFRGTVEWDSGLDDPLAYWRT